MKQPTMSCQRYYSMLSLAGLEIEGVVKGFEAKVIGRFEGLILTALMMNK